MPATSLVPCVSCCGPARIGRSSGFRFSGVRSTEYQRLCRTCFDRNTARLFRCHCGSWTTFTRDLITVDEHGCRTQAARCNVCAFTTARCCSGCGLWFTNLHGERGRALVGPTCDECAAREDEELLENDEYECESDSDCECDSCLDGRVARSFGSPIHGYGYKPLPVFHDTDDRQSVRATPLVPYLGLELEITTDHAREVAQLLTDARPSLIYCKDDGSVHGVEMVTHPMTLDYARASLPFDELRTVRHQYDGSGYPNGIHVHVSRTAFTSDTHVYRWMKLLYRNAPHVELLARRKSTEWASFENTERANQKLTAERRRGEKSEACRTLRYSAINVENSATFEVRVFRGSLKAQEILGALELIDASVEYSRTLTAASVIRAAGWEWPTFTTWLDAREDRYANLRAEITKLDRDIPTVTRPASSRAYPAADTITYNGITTHTYQPAPS